MRLMVMYLHSAFCHSCGSNTLKWAKIDDTGLEKVACLDDDFEEIIARMGLQLPGVSLSLTIQL